MSIFRAVLSPDAAETAVLRRALDARTTGESVVREVRALLGKPVPTWASKISEETALTEAKLDELDHALQARITFLEDLPAAPRRDRALERHREAAALIARMRSEMAARSGAPPAIRVVPAPNHDIAHAEQFGS